MRWAKPPAVTKFECRAPATGIGLREVILWRSLIGMHMLKREYLPLKPQECTGWTTGASRNNHVGHPRFAIGLYISHGSRITISASCRQDRLAQVRHHRTLISALPEPLFNPRTAHHRNIQLLGSFRTKPPRPPADADSPSCPSSSAAVQYLTSNHYA